MREPNDDTVAVISAREVSSRKNLQAQIGVRFWNRWVSPQRSRQELWRTQARPPHSWVVPSSGQAALAVCLRRWALRILA